MENENIQAEIVKQMITLKVQQMFRDFVYEHVENTKSETEKNALVTLINNEDEWSMQILKNLWVDFEQTKLSQQTLEQMAEQAMQIFTPQKKE